MALHFPRAIHYATPGVLALLGHWWVYSHRKKHASCHDKQEVAIEEEQQEEVPGDGSSPKTEECIPQRQPFSLEEECPENETSTSLLSAGLLLPHLLCQAQERLDLSEDLPGPSVITIQYSTLEDNGETLDSRGSQEESSVPACVSLPLSQRPEGCHSSTAVSLRQGSSCSANQEQWPSATLTQESLGIVEISSAEQSDDSSVKPPKDSQMPEVVLLNPGSVAALCLQLEKGASAPQGFLNNEVEVVSSPKDSAVSVLPDSLESGCLQSREEVMSDSIVSTVPVCQKDSQTQGDELEREKIGGVSLNKEEVEEIEQVATQAISKVILAATEKVLSGPASDVSTQSCQATASSVERPRKVASVVSSDQMLAEEATAADENIAVRSGGVVLTSPRTEERDHSVTDPSESNHRKKIILPCECCCDKEVQEGVVEPGDGIPWQMAVLFAFDCVGICAVSQVKMWHMTNFGKRQSASTASSALGKWWQVPMEEWNMMYYGMKSSSVPAVRKLGMQLQYQKLRKTLNWLLLPDGVTVEVVVAHQVDAGHVSTSAPPPPTFHVLRSLDQQTYACCSDPAVPTLPTPAEVGIICAAPGLDGAWLRAQVISYFEETGEVELRYVDGGYDKVKIDTLRQIRSDLLSLPFQEAEVLRGNVVPPPGEDQFSSEADAAVAEMSRGAVLAAQVTYDSASLPLIGLWDLMGDEVVSINETLVGRGFAQWLSY
ncbi:LOW QUALITY PROTEIN: A-kinase anchor protein 1, mitochondrial [Rhynochetos jubatus]